MDGQEASNDNVILVKWDEGANFGSTLQFSISPEFLSELENQSPAGDQNGVSPVANGQHPNAIVVENLPHHTIIPLGNDQFRIVPNTSFKAVSQEQIAQDATGTVTQHPISRNASADTVTREEQIAQNKSGAITRGGTASDRLDTDTQYEITVTQEKENVQKKIKIKTTNSHNESNGNDECGNEDVEDNVQELSDSEMSLPCSKRVKRIKRFHAPFLKCGGRNVVMDMPEGTSLNEKAEQKEHNKQRYYTRKHEAEHKKNMVVSVFKEDALMRVLVSESLPYLCALCGESFAHTATLREHVEQMHNYFEAMAKKTNSKPQVIIERSFNPVKISESSNETMEGKKIIPVETVPVNAENTTPPENGQQLEKPSIPDTEQESCPGEVLPTTSLVRSPTNFPTDDDESMNKDKENKICDDESVSDEKNREGVLHLDFVAKNNVRKTEGQMDMERTEKIEGKMELARTRRNERKPLDRRKKKTSRKKKKDEFTVVKVNSKVNVKETENIAKMDSGVNNGLDKSEGEAEEKENGQNKKDAKTISPLCVVCGLKNKTRVIYRKHLAEAHQIFPSYEEAVEYGKKFKMDIDSADFVGSYNEGTVTARMRTRGNKTGLVDGKRTCTNSKNGDRTRMKIIKCAHCDSFVFENLTLQKHMRTHCGIPGVKCDICVEGIRLMDEGKVLELHGLMEKFLSMDRRPDDVDYVCEDGNGARKEGNRISRFTYSNIVSSCYECGERYYMRYHMGNHNKRAHTCFTCKVCDKSVSTLLQLKTHSMKKHGKGIFTCRYCPRAFHDAGKYNYHLAGHLGVYQCPGCKRNFLEKPSLDHHLSKYANHPTHFENPESTSKEEYSLDKPFIFDGYVDRTEPVPMDLSCPVCGEAFTNSGNLTKHMNVRHEELLSRETNYVCDICGRMFGSRKNHTAHMKSHVKRFKCTFDGCDKAYHMLYLLKEHLHSHSATKNFHCNQCEKSFRTVASLRHHKLVHNEDAPIYQCHICQKNCRSRAYLRIHLEGVHSTDKNYQCELCGKRFSARHRLRSHASVHKKRKHGCDKCPASFLRPHLLASHLKTHEKPFSCRECLKTFKKEATYKRHLYAKHNIGEPTAQRNYKSSKRKAPSPAQLVIEEAPEDEILNIRVEIPPGQTMMNENFVALISGMHPMP